MPITVGLYDDSISVHVHNMGTVFLKHDIETDTLIVHVHSARGRQIAVDGTGDDDSFSGLIVGKREEQEMADTPRSPSD